MFRLATFKHFDVLLFAKFETGMLSLTHELIMPMLNRSGGYFYNFNFQMNL